MARLEDFCTPEEVARIKYICKLFNAQRVTVKLMQTWWVREFNKTKRIYEIFKAAV